MRGIRKLNKSEIAAMKQSGHYPATFVHTSISTGESIVIDNKNRAEKGLKPITKWPAKGLVGLEAKQAIMEAICHAIERDKG